ncbi:MAG: anhydro-N-acetylmuramic acid kinase [Hyphomicrobiaceae bacterium]
MGKIRRALGLMSGTSMDGIDIALIETDGEDHVRRLAAGGVPYEPDFRERLRGALRDAQAIKQRNERPGSLAAVEAELTRLHAEAVLRFIGDRVLQPSAIDVIGFHGQTVLHAPERGLTVQIGDGAVLAAATGIDVVHDLRAADCAAGGQGAPLAPAYHRALAAKVPERPVAFVNIGGVANITWIGADGALIAFDTGPGNAMIDDWMRWRTGLPRDDGGIFAAKGKVHEAYVTEYLRHSHFAAPVPKSLDRNAFAVELVDQLSTEDGAATLTAFTAASIARAREHVPEEPRLWIIAGGGRRNRTLMAMLAGLVHGAVVPVEALGFDGDAVEAEAWAYLAVRSLDGRPITYPGTTGVPVPLTGGVLSRA